MISLKQRRRHLELGALATRDALWRAMVFIVSAHCACPSVIVGDMGRYGEMCGDVWRCMGRYGEIGACPSVMVAEPSLSALMRLKLSMITPTKRLSAKKEPTNIQKTKKSEIIAASCRSGAKPTCNRVHWARRWD